MGLTTGEPTADGIAPALAASRLAVYDPDADRIYLSADVSPEAAAADLRIALEQAYAAQHGPVENGAAESPTPDESTTGFLGVSPPPQIAAAAIDSYIAHRETAGGATTDDTAGAATAEAATASALPVPIEYQLAAIDDLGEALLSSAGVDPTAARFGVPYPENVGAALDDGARPTASGALQVGDRSLAPPDRARRRRLVAGVGIAPAAVDGRPTGIDRRRRLVPPDRPRRTDLCGCRVRDRQSDGCRDRAGGDADLGRRLPGGRAVDGHATGRHAGPALVM